MCRIRLSLPGGQQGMSAGSDRPAVLCRELCPLIPRSEPRGVAKMSRQVVFLLALMGWISGGVAHLCASDRGSPSPVPHTMTFSTNTSGKEFFDLEVILKGAVTVSTSGIMISTATPRLSRRPGTVIRACIGQINRRLYSQWQQGTTSAIPLLEPRIVRSGDLLGRMRTTRGSQLKLYWDRIQPPEKHIATDHQPLSSQRRYLRCSNGLPGKGFALDALNATNEYLAKAMVKIADSASPGA